MWIDYPNQITESPEALLREEKRLKATPMLIACVSCACSKARPVPRPR